MKDNTKMITALLIGAAIGGAVAWFLTSDKKEEIIEELKDAAGKAKEDITDTVEKGKKLVEDIKEKAEGYFSKQQ